MDLSGFAAATVGEFLVGTALVVGGFCTSLLGSERYDVSRARIGGP